MMSLSQTDSTCQSQQLSDTCGQDELCFLARQHKGGGVNWKKMLHKECAGD